MSGTFIMSSRQAAELDHALERCGWSAADVKRLSSGELLATLLLVIRGHAEVVQREHHINCDADPFLPEGCNGLEFHRKHGELIWQAGKLKLWLSEEQQSGIIVGTELREQIREQPALNANVLDYLLQHPTLIPEEWKGKLVFFWGTIYRYADGRLCVRCLDWGGDKWRWRYRWLLDQWDGSFPAAVSCE